MVSSKVQAGRFFEVRTGYGFTVVYLSVNSQVSSIARERQTKRAQWLRDPHSFEPGAIPRLTPF